MKIPFVRRARYEEVKKQCELLAEQYRAALDRSEYWRTHYEEATKRYNERMERLHKLDEQIRDLRSTILRLDECKDSL